MNKLLVAAVLGCLGLSACEQTLPGDSPNDPGSPASEAKPVYAPTPWQEPDFMRRGGVNNSATERPPQS